MYLSTMSFVNRLLRNDDKVTIFFIDRFVDMISTFSHSCIVRKNVFSRLRVDYRKNMRVVATLTFYKCWIILQILYVTIHGWIVSIIQTRFA